MLSTLANRLISRFGRRYPRHGKVRRASTFSPTFELLEDRVVLSVSMTDQEQLLVELINRARSNPTGEAALYGIGLNDGLAPGTISSAPKPPLAPHQALINAAGAHSQDMLDFDYFSHTNLLGQSPVDRAVAAGYPSTFVGENIAWGGSTGPIDQNAQVDLRHENLFLSPGHRQNMLSESYREIGPGVRYGVFTGYDASMVTEMFAAQSGNAFLTGVAYADLTMDDNFYTIGEGIDNLSITAVHSTTGNSYATSTGTSGGYTIQVPTGTYTVTASGTALSGPITVSGVVIGAQNVKVDFDASALPGQVNSVQIIDDGQSGFTTVGNWVYFAGQGRQADLRFSAAGTGSDLARWTFTVTPGQYRVSASWWEHPNRATNAPFTIRDGSTAVGTVLINQEQSPNDLADGGTVWEHLGGPYNIMGTTLVVELSDSANEYVVADAIRIERIGDVILAPEIELVDGSATISDGGTVNFGTTQPNVAVDRQLVVRNVGTANLTLTPLGAGSLPPGYSLVANFGSTNLAPGASTTFTIRLASASEGTFAGSLSFGNNDADENPFNLSLTGVVASAPAVQIIDDGQSGFSTVGSWVYFAGQGRQADLRFSARGTGSDLARWTFSVTPGQYRVSASWWEHPNRATNAPYTIRDGSMALGTVRINQEQAPNDLGDSGTMWEDLGGPYNITGSTLMVELSDSANEYVIADAMRIERIGNLPPPPPIQIIDNGSASFSLAGNWSLHLGQGVDNDLHFSAAGNGNGVARWTFLVTPGRYRVSATWQAHPNRATNAPYTIRDGNSVLGTVAINQEQSPNDFSDAGALWEDLGGPYVVAGTMLVVELSDAANEYVIADAVRIERVS